jgi:hypothetical protein
MKQFSSIEKLDTGILYTLEFASNDSALLLAFGLIASMANNLPQDCTRAEFGHRMPLNQRNCAETIMSCIIQYCSVLTVSSKYFKKHGYWEKRHLKSQQLCDSLRIGTLFFFHRKDKRDTLVFCTS